MMAGASCCFDKAWGVSRFKPKAIANPELAHAHPNRPQKDEAVTVTPKVIVGVASEGRGDMGAAFLHFIVLV
ncbi:hypothetical protein TIFTF001_005168 [Ficus carica]|uniref:Uncharacterized protein n=1 Tax=Ficus carica TaxID=3494 RepID=A0AA88CZ12_FICCA|nr:hypothetical protein TIFTF001_005168 [Ficus carica]